MILSISYYFKGSDSNTLALIRKLGLADVNSPHGSSPSLNPKAADDVHRILERVPDQQILDFLVQYFVAEVNWMDQLVHILWFLAKYQRWSLIERVRLVTEVDFAILVLHICSYASQFPPSPGNTLDKIRGILLADVRAMCDEAADNLAAISTATDRRGSLIRVQHLAFSALQCQIAGKMTAFWEALNRPIRVAQSVGMHSEATRLRQGVETPDHEMERRTFCNLYIRDSLLSRQLDRIPFLPGCLHPADWPQLQALGYGRTGGENMDVDAPDPFTERLLQARLADYWRKMGPMQGGEYDMMVAEERYDKFCREYLSQLPPGFAIVDPDATWDKRFPKLVLQRKLLHIAIYDSLCWNFRALLLQRPLPLPHDINSVESLSLPTYKRVLLTTQETALAVAALKSMDRVTQLHALLGGCHTRLAALVFSTFEAAVLLVYLCMDPMFPRGCDHQSEPRLSALKMDPLQADICSVTRHGSLQAVQGALKRLRMLAEVSSMAEVGASTLAQLLSKVTDDVVLIPNQDVVSSATTTGSQLGATTTTGDVASWFPCDDTDLRSVNDFMSIGRILPAGDMASWSSFDAVNMYAQDDFVSMSTALDI
ncbi:hypothetical protein CC80DRAFT_523240 [Byssothecium circinans]|uniref:Transcription factor domain-containing protein n=1 Tax=Byssothecium circinans TaxID=147558 RepID=A0A6A5U854_9PLEO|nr:hypothetical protein CC80DRAFT_523240 [Byssothecium circinans]